MVADQLKPVTVLVEGKYLPLVNAAAAMCHQKRSAYVRLLILEDLRKRGLIPEEEDIIIAGGSSTDADR